MDLTVVTPATLDFTSETWDAPQTVTIRGVDDEIDDDNETVNVRHTASGGDYGDANFNCGTTSHYREHRRCRRGDSQR